MYVALFGMNNAVASLLSINQPSNSKMELLQSHVEFIVRSHSEVVIHTEVHQEYLQKSSNKHLNSVPGSAKAESNSRKTKHLEMSKKDRSCYLFIMIFEGSNLKIRKMKSPQTHVLAR